MQDKVGSQVPSADEIAKAVLDVRALLDRIAPYTVTLSAEERAATVKMRTGGENVVAQIGALAQAHAITLPQVSVDGMLADLTLAQRLRPLANAVEQLSQRLGDAVLEAQSECWWATTALYTALSRVAGANATLESELKPVVEFFAVGRRKRPATPAQASAQASAAKSA
jgi:hypothetical protein